MNSKKFRVYSNSSFYFALYLVIAVFAIPVTVESFSLIPDEIGGSFSTVELQYAGSMNYSNFSVNISQGDNEINITGCDGYNLNFYSCSGSLNGPENITISFDLAKGLDKELDLTLYNGSQSLGVLTVAVYTKEVYYNLSLNEARVKNDENITGSIFFSKAIPGLSPSDFSSNGINSLWVEDGQLNKSSYDFSFTAAQAEGLINTYDVGITSFLEDVLGNELSLAASDNASFTIDSLPPEVSNLSINQTRVGGSDNAVSIEAIVFNATSYELRLIHADDTTTIQTNAISVNGSQDIVADVTSIKDGVYSVELWVEDEVGNNDSVYHPAAFEKDSKKPELVSISPTNANLVLSQSSDLNFSFDFTFNKSINDSLSFPGLEVSSNDDFVCSNYIFTASNVLTVDCSYVYSDINQSVDNVSFTLKGVQDNFKNSLDDVIFQPGVSLYTEPPRGYSASFLIPYVNIQSQNNVPVSFSSSQNQEIDFVINDGSGNSVSGFVSSNSSSELDMNALDDGSLTLHYWVEDMYGNIGENKSISITKDTVPPSLFQIQSEEVVSGINQDDFVIDLFNLSGYSDVSYYLSDGVNSLSGAISNSTLGQNDDSFTVNISNFDDRTIEIRVTAFDAFNNSRESMKLVDKISARPTGLVLLSFDEIINSGNQENYKVLFGGVDSSLAVNYSFNDSASFVSGSVSGNQADFDADLSSLDDGLVTMTVFAIDEYGNRGENIVRTLEKETILPSVHINLSTSVITRSLAQDFFEFKLNFSKEMNPSIQPVIDLSKSGFDFLTPCHSQWQDNNSIYSFKCFVSSSMQESTGDIDVTVSTATDTFGNRVETVVFENAFKIATKIPSNYDFELTSPTNIIDANYADNFSVRVFENLYNYSEYRLELKDALANSLVSTNNITGSNKTSPLNITSLEDGLIDIYFEMFDEFGNKGNVIEKRVSLQSSSPSNYSVSFNEDFYNKENADKGSFSILGAQSADKYVWSITDINGLNISGEDYVTRDAIKVDNLDLRSLAEGELNLSLRLEDSVGNKGDWVFSQSVLTTEGPNISGVSLNSNDPWPSSDALSFNIGTELEELIITSSPSTNQGDIIECVYESVGLGYYNVANMSSECNVVADMVNGSYYDLKIRAIDEYNNHAEVSLTNLGFDLRSIVASNAILLKEGASAEFVKGDDLLTFEVDLNKEVQSANFKIVGAENMSFSLDKKPSLKYSKDFGFDISELALTDKENLTFEVTFSDIADRNLTLSNKDLGINVTYLSGDDLSIDSQSFTTVKSKPSIEGDYTGAQTNSIKALFGTQAYEAEVYDNNTWKISEGEVMALASRVDPYEVQIVIEDKAGNSESQFIDILKRNREYKFEMPVRPGPVFKELRYDDIRDIQNYQELTLSSFLNSSGAVQRDRLSVDDVSAVWIYDGNNWVAYSKDHFKYNYSSFKFSDYGPAFDGYFRFDFKNSASTKFIQHDEVTVN